MTLIVLVASLVILVRRGAREGPFGPIHLFVYSLAYGTVLNGIVLRGDPSTALPGSPLRFSHAGLPRAELLLALGITAIAVGTLIPISIPQAWRLATYRVRSLPVLHLLVFTLGTLLVFFLYVSLLAGSFSGAVTGLRGRVIGGAAGATHVYLLLPVVSLGALALSQAAQMSGRVLVKRVNLVVQVLVVAGLFLAGGRTLPATHVISLAALSSLRPGPGRRRRDIVIAAGLATSSLIFLLVGLAVRDSTQQRVTVAAALRERMEDVPAALSESYPMTDVLSMSEEYAKRNGHNWGSEYLTYGIRFVPRAVWAEKPVPLSTHMRREFYGDELAGLPAMVFGEFLIAGGIPVLVVGSLGIGLLLRWLSEAWALSRTNPRIAVGTVALAWVVAFSVARGGFETGFFDLLVVFVVLRFLRGWGRHRNRVQGLEVEPTSARVPA